MCLCHIRGFASSMCTLHMMPGKPAMFHISLLMPYKGVCLFYVHFEYAAWQASYCAHFFNVYNFWSAEFFFCTSVLIHDMEL